MLQLRKDRPRRKRSLLDAWPVLRRSQERGRDGCEGGIQLGAKTLHHGNDGDEIPAAIRRIRLRLQWTRPHET
jgi:hypothetical protein